MICDRCGAESKSTTCLDCMVQEIPSWPHEGQAFRTLVERANIIQSLWDLKLSDTEISNVVGIHPETVRNWRQKLDLPHPTRHYVNAQAVEKLWEKDLSDPEIARELGLSHQTVFRWRKKLGLPSNR